MSSEFFIGFSESTGAMIRPYLQGFSDAMVDVPGGVLIRTSANIYRLANYLSENNLEAHIQMHTTFSATTLRDNKAYMEFFKGSHVRSYPRINTGELPQP